MDNITPEEYIVKIQHHSQAKSCLPPCSELKKLVITVALDCGCCDCCETVAVLQESFMQESKEEDILG